MTRQQLIEQILRDVYGGQPTDDAAITPNLVNQLINQGIGVAIKQNYKEALQLDNIGYVNNSFYITYKGLNITQDENFLWKADLPQIPIAIGQNEGVSNIVLKDTTDKIVGINLIPLNMNQRSYASSMKTIPFATLYYIEGGSIYILSSLTLSKYKVSVTMVSGGDSTNLFGKLNVPDDYIPVIVGFVTQALLNQRKIPQDQTNDGVSN
jgi:hypothetical protein